MTCQSSFESCPSEIFFEVWDYLSYRDVYRSFSNLNQHFKLMLASYNNVPARITSYQDVDVAALEFFSSRITRLSTSFRYFTGLSSLSSLRSLRIVDKPLSYSHYYSFRFLVNLEHICIVQTAQWNNKYLLRLSDDVMSNYFPRLRLCQIGEVTRTFHSLWQPLLYLRSLTISTKDPNIYHQILYYCPSLTRLKLTIDFLTRPTSLEYSQHLSLRKFELCLILRSISICQILGYLLTPLPNLTHMTVHGPEHHSKQLDIHLLRHLLRKHVSKLEQFHLQMLVDKTLALKLRNEDYRIHPLFRRMIIDQKTSHLSLAKITLSTS
ncbi:unnamed protein product [Adineta ricciae]|uniref:F-box domain-containing protein n=1 Tax=Adineta ricciae TaxID=249248 RepID=A0A814AGY4_ADIRI|nr:unnamed protein product [Adineta ricciae]CAF1620549.1 unnamed protein product [Adineta ricciae]